MSQVNNLITNYRRHVGILRGNKLAAGNASGSRSIRPLRNDGSGHESRVRDRYSRSKTPLDADRYHGSSRRLAGRSRYREAYFEEPSALSMIAEDLKAYVVVRAEEACQAADADKDTVVAVLGAGSLFGFLHVSGVIIIDLEESIRGRLLGVFSRRIRAQRLSLYGRSRRV